MNANVMNSLCATILIIILTGTMNAQNSSTILLNNERVEAQIIDGEVTSVDKEIPLAILDALRSPVDMNASYYKELNDIIDGKYGTFYADLVKKEFEAIQSGKLKEKKEALSRTATLDVEPVSVKFHSKTARLVGQSSEDLVKFTEKLQTLNINYILLEGHKASNEINDYILTTNRVNACKDYLTFKGIDAKKIRTKILLETSGKNTSNMVKLTVK